MFGDGVKKCLESTMGQQNGPFLTKIQKRDKDIERQRKERGVDWDE